MSGKKSKLIRKVVYGDHAHRGNTQYRTHKDGSLRCVGLRRQYQDLKKKVK